MEQHPGRGGVATEDHGINLGREGGSEAILGGLRFCSLEGAPSRTSDAGASTMGASGGSSPSDAPEPASPSANLSLLRVPPRASSPKVPHAHPPLPSR